MRCYKVSTVKLVTVGDAPPKSVFQYAGTNALAKEVRDGFMVRYAFKKKDVTIEMVEVPLAKGELISFLNELVCGSI